MNEITKNYVIYILIGVIFLLLIYILFQEPEIKTVVKTNVETVENERIIYKDKKCPKINSETIVNDNLSENIIENKEFTLASTSDANHLHNISIVSKEKPMLSSKYEKVILNGKLIIDNEESIFILDLNKKLIDSLNDVYIKVKNTFRDETYSVKADCLYGLVENYIYFTNLEVYGDELVCTVFEDRELDEVGDTKNNTNKTFLKFGTPTIPITE
jgi:hypothetical protein